MGVVFVIGIHVILIGMIVIPVAFALAGFFG